MMADGYRNATMTNSSLGIQYTATSGCTLQVGLICGNNTEVMNGPLSQTVNTCNFQTW